MGHWYSAENKGWSFIVKDDVTVTISGVKETISNLKRWQVVKTEVTKTALKEIGFKTEGDAKRDCPVDTGRLRASISTNWAGSPLVRGRTGGKAEQGDGVGKPSGPVGLVVVTGTNVKYAPYVEFGTIRALKWGGYRTVAGRSYLGKAYHKNEPELRMRIKRIFKK